MDHMTSSVLSSYHLNLGRSLSFHLQSVFKCIFWIRLNGLLVIWMSSWENSFPNQIQCYIIRLSWVYEILKYCLNYLIYWFYWANISELSVIILGLTGICRKLSEKLWENSTKTDHFYSFFLFYFKFQWQMFLPCYKCSCFKTFHLSKDN